MALIKSIESPHGVTVSYWRVVEVSINWLARRARIGLAGYLDAAARKAGKEPLLPAAIDVSEDDFDATFTLKALAGRCLARAAYEHVAKQQAFAGAESDDKPALAVIPKRRK